MIPMLEPSNQQEAYDMVYDGFELSERLGYPVLLRITTRMAYSRSGVTVRPARPENKMHCLPDGRLRFILLPALARQRYKQLLAAQDLMTTASEESKYNRYFDGPIKNGASSRRALLLTIFRKIIPMDLSILIEIGRASCRERV